MSLNEHTYQGRNDKADRIPGNKDFHTHRSRKDKKNAYKELFFISDCSPKRWSVTKSNLM